jgi:hypothetical protein
MRLLMQALRYGRTLHRGQLTVDKSTIFRFCN